VHLIKSDNELLTFTYVMTPTYTPQRKSVLATRYTSAFKWDGTEILTHLWLSLHCRTSICTTDIKMLAVLDSNTLKRC